MFAELISLIPIIIAALIGAISQDFFVSKKREPKKLSVRFFGVLFSALLAAAIVWLGGSFFSIEKVIDWKGQAFISLIIGYLGSRIGELLATTTFGLRMIGQNATADAMDKELERFNEIRKEKEKRIVEINAKLSELDRDITRHQEDEVEAGKIDVGYKIFLIIDEKKKLREEKRRLKEEIDRI